jgi:GTP:adenosylcobinamide-phosphate guanylyltransferase
MMIYAEPILVYHVDIDIYRSEMIDTSSFYIKCVACIKWSQVSRRGGGVRVSYYGSLGVNAIHKAH